MFLRHWGGEGHSSYACIINSRVVSKVSEIHYQPRSASIILKDFGVQPLCLIGLHGWHGLDSTTNTLSEVAWHLSRVTGVRIFNKLVVGDWNIDLAWFDEIHRRFGMSGRIGRLDGDWLEDYFSRLTRSTPVGVGGLETRDWEHWKD